MSKEIRPWPERPTKGQPSSEAPRDLGNPGIVRIHNAGHHPTVLRRDRQTGAWKP